MYNILYVESGLKLFQILHICFIISKKTNISTRIKSPTFSRPLEVYVDLQLANPPVKLSVNVRHNPHRKFKQNAIKYSQFGNHSISLMFNNLLFTNLSEPEFC